METRKRKTKYELGREEALTEVLTILSLSIDVYPKSPSPETLACVTSSPELAAQIVEQLKRFRSVIAADVRRTKPVEAIA